MPLDKWDQRFLDIAIKAAEWSKDPNARVGAVVVDPQGQIAGVGYNGFPKMVEDSAERLNNQEIKLEMVVHAEENAILGAGQRARGGSIYVFGKPVCARCAGTIIQAGISRVIAERPAEPPPTGTEESKWARSGRIGFQMLEEARLVLVPISN